MTALAGLVPCADAGMSTTSRCPSPRSLVIGADHQQAGELALRARVRLQRHRRKAGDLAQRRFELAADLPVACASGRPARTGASARTLPSVTGYISLAALSFIVHEPSGIIEVSSPMSLRSRLLHVAHHLGLGMMRVEDRMRQDTATCAAAPAGMTLARAARATRADRSGRLLPRDAGEDADDVAARPSVVDRFVERDADAVVAA